MTNPYKPEKVADITAWLLRGHGSELSPLGRDYTDAEIAAALTAVSAERDEVRAGVVAEESEDPDAGFEYRVRNDVAGYLSVPMTLSGARDEVKIDPHDFIERRRKPDEWTPVAFCP